MKMKSFAVLATSGLMAALFAYAVPAIAEDTSTSGTQQAQPSDNNAQNPSSNSTQGSGSSTQSDMNSSPSTPSSTDESTPEKDSATGDDDY